MEKDTQERRIHMAPRKTHTAAQHSAKNYILAIAIDKYEFCTL